MIKLQTKKIEIVIIIFLIVRLSFASNFQKEYIEINQNDIHIISRARVFLVILNIKYLASSVDNIKIME